MPRTVFFKKIENTTPIAGNAIWTPTEAQLSEGTDVDKWRFFNHLTVYNNSAFDIEVRLNGENVTDLGVEFLPAGTALVFDAEDKVRYTRPAIYNRSSSGTISANQIILMIRKVE